MRSGILRDGPGTGWLAILAVALATAFADATPSAGQLVPLSPDFQVNEYTTGSQEGSLVTTAPDGSFTVVWCCGKSPSGSSYEPIVARRFDAQGQPLGGEFQVSQYGRSAFPSGIGADAAGQFVVAWGHGHYGCPGCWSDYVKGRRWTAEGQPRGEQFTVSDPPGGIYTGDGRVAVASGGGFVVAWNDYGAWAKRYDPDGTPLGPAFQVGGEGGASSYPEVTPLPADGFLIVWHDWNAMAHLDALLAQRYDSNGLPAGARIQVTDPLNRATNADVSSAPDGAFVVARTAYSTAAEGKASGRPQGPRGGSPAYSDEIEVRRFSADGTPLGPAENANTIQVPPTFSPVVRYQADGGFVVAWDSAESEGTDTSYASIQARVVATDGTMLGRQLQLNDWTPRSQFWPSMAFQPNGDLIVTWSSFTSPGSDSDSLSILARRFRVAFFMDGFETGDASRWSATEPLAGSRTGSAKAGGGPAGGARGLTK